MDKLTNIHTQSVFTVLTLKSESTSIRDTDVYNSLLDSVGEGEGGMIWENGIEKKKEKKNLYF